uniref:Uncharacterized protein n=1 Tax=Romanomermis culicivorax TaxID=13658 RepID=A0A915J2E3_ROMCU
MTGALCGWVSPLLFKHSMVDEDLAYAQDIRQQFLEQVKCLEQRTECQSSLLNELQDFYKRRADIEVDYSKNLDKLNKHLLAKQKADRQKREGWSNFSLYNHYLQAIEEVKSEAKCRAALADLYINHVSVKLTNQAEELQRISKKCREISVVAQQEILRVLGELHTAMKTYQLCQAASWTAENKVRAVEAQKCKYEESNPKKIGRRRHRFLEKEYERKNDKFKEFQLKALKAKNEYLLCIDAANAALHKYFADDLSDLLDCMDVGFEEWLKYLLSTLTDCRQAVVDSDQRYVQSCCNFARDLDHRIDKRRFLDANHSTFMLPRKFEFKAHFSDIEAPHRVRSQKSFQEDYTQRYCQISQRLMQLKTETEEVWKTLETAEKTLMDIQKLPEMKWSDLFACHSTCKHQTAGPTSITASYVNTSNNFSSTTTNNPVINNSSGSATNEISRRNSCRETEASQQKRKQDLYEIEDYYLQNHGLVIIFQKAGSFEHSRSQSINGGDSGAIAHCPLSGSALPSGVSTTTTASNSGGFLESSPSPNPNSDSSYAGPAVPAGAVRTRRKKRIGVSAQAHNRKRPKLFGGSIEEYVEMTGQDIPLIIRSCVRMLSLHDFFSTCICSLFLGLHHQGVFRVSGSQIEINSFRDSFEKGEDPLSDIADSSDVNSVAGVLKLYFRELREPLFPIFMFDQFVECSRIENKDEFARTVRELVLTLPRPVFVVMRYIFAFLNQ